MCNNNNNDDDDDNNNSLPVCVARIDAQVHGIVVMSSMLQAWSREVICRVAKQKTKPEGVI